MDRLLIVDDDVALAEELRMAFVARGDKAEVANSGLPATKLLRTMTFDFIVLDWDLPDLDGLTILKKVRSEGIQTPIIFLTGRHEIEGKMDVLDSGADDYMTKPFDMRELLARMRTIKRRQNGGQQSSKLSMHDVEFAPQLRLVTRGQERVRLTNSEGEILEFLLRNRDQFFSQADLFKVIWPADSDVAEQTVKSHVRTLRMKLAKIGAPDLVRTERGGGYIIRDKSIEIDQVD